MEPSWSPVVATDGKQWQTGSVQKRGKQAITVALGCDQLLKGAHDKEGVDGSSPSEGSAKAPHVGAFSFRTTCSLSCVRWVWSRLWSFRVVGTRSLVDRTETSARDMPDTRCARRRNG